MSRRRVLIAGIGNIFFGDDGFGVEVARRLIAAGVPAGVDVVDYGIRGVHLAYDLLDGRYGALVMVDAVPFGDERPGSLAVYEIGDGQSALPTTDVEAEIGGALVDAHAMHPDAVLETLQSLGGHVDRVLVLGCRPESFTVGMELTPPVSAAVDEAVALLRRLVAEEFTGDGQVADDEVVRVDA